MSSPGGEQFDDELSNRTRTGVGRCCQGLKNERVSSTNQSDSGNDEHGDGEVPLVSGGKDQSEEKRLTG